jgi:hypothetical protein
MGKRETEIRKKYAVKRRKLAKDDKQYVPARSNRALGAVLLVGVAIFAMIATVEAQRAGDASRVVAERTAWRLEMAKKREAFARGLDRRATVAKGPCRAYRGATAMSEDDCEDCNWRVEVYPHATVTMAGPTQSSSTGTNPVVTTTTVHDLAMVTIDDGSGPVTNFLEGCDYLVEFGNTEDPHLVWVYFCD